MMVYVCYNEYFATGEGRTVWLSLEAGTRKEAKQAHIDRFKVDGYFHCGIAVISVTKRNAKRIREILSQHIPNLLADRVIEGDCNLDFGVYLHLNCS